MNYTELFTVLLITTCSLAEHILVGHWTFEQGEEFEDLTGNFGDITLHGGAEIMNGKLDLGNGNWATASGFTGNIISEKTLVSWFSIDSLDVQNGAVLSIDKISIDQFDAIVLGELKKNYWIAGSSGYQRTIEPVPGYEETEENVMIQLAITYENNNSSAVIKLYRNGVMFGNYTYGPFVSWPAGDTEILWGCRHFVPPNCVDWLDAHIIESQIYAGILTEEDLKLLTPKNDPSCNVAEGTLKLDNSTSPPLIMMCIQGQWGYLCDGEVVDIPWTLENVGVACQQLGYIRDDSYDPVSLQISLVVYPVHYRFVHCTGVEKRLIDCEHGDTNVTHQQCLKNGNYKYGVAACTTKPVACSDPSVIKIINDTIIQICSQGEWYSICGDSNKWSQAHAMVACRQLELNPIGSISSGLAKANIDNVNFLNVMFHCVGNEDSLVECSSSTISQCNNIASVTCGEAPSYSTSHNSLTNDFSSCPSTLGTISVTDKTVTSPVTSHTTNPLISFTEDNEFSSICPTTTISTMISVTVYSTVRDSYTATTPSNTPVATTEDCPSGSSSSLSSFPDFFQNFQWLFGIAVGIIITVIIVGIIVIIVHFIKKKNKPELSYQPSRNLTSERFSKGIDQEQYETMECISETPIYSELDIIKKNDNEYL